MIRRLLVTLGIALASLAMIAIPTARAQSLTSPRGCWAYYWAQVCYQINGTGTYVDSFATAMTNETWPGTLYVEDRIVGPDGFATAWWDYPIELGNQANSLFTEDRDMPTGSYCAQFDIYGEPVAQHCYSVE